VERSHSRLRKNKSSKKPVPQRTQINIKKMNRMMRSIITIITVKRPNRMHLTAKKKNMLRRKERRRKKKRESLKRN